ncbi:MAG: FtsX-like permease family protein [Alphaproteobacteria bacterium]|nr:FtsX-like permease family protein [Alphaproteobacteria bacterium]
MVDRTLDTTLPASPRLGATAPLALRLARRELRGGLKGFRIFTACLALGVGAIAAVGSLTSAITGGLTRDARTILGADVELRQIYNPITPEQRAHLAASGTVSELVELRTMARVAMPGRTERRLVDLKAVDNLYPLYGAAQVEPPQPVQDALARKPGRDGVARYGILLDADLVPTLKVALGDVVRIGDADLEFRGTLVKEPDRGGNPFSIAPRAMIAAAVIPQTGLLRPGSIVNFEYRLRFAEGVDLAGWKADLAARFPQAGWRVRDYRESSPAVRQFVERIAMFLTLVGLTSLLVGGVGVSNAVRAFLAEKTRTIATLKCLGAPARLVWQVYLVLIAALSLVGIGAGLLFGIAVPPVLGATLGDALPVALDGGLQVRPLLMAAAFGLLTAVAFSILPLARARDVSPASLFRDLVAPVRRLPSAADVAALLGVCAGLAALAVLNAADRRIGVFFVVGAIGALLLFRGGGVLATQAAAALSGVRAIVAGRPALRLALANLHRPGAVTAAVVMSLGLGLTVLVAIAQIQGNLSRQVTETLPERAPSYYFVDIQPDQVAPLAAMVAATPGASDFQETPMVRGRIVGIAGEPAEKRQIAPNAQWALRGDRGLTYAATQPADAKIVTGTWWPADYRGPALVSLDHEIAQGFGIGVGDTVTINVLGREFVTRIANTRRVDWLTLGINFTFIVSPGILDSAPRTHIATMRTEPGIGEPLFQKVTDLMPNVSAIPVRDALETVAKVLQHIGVAVRSTAALTLIAGTLVLAGAIASGHRRRVYDAIVLKVVGASRRQVVAAFVLEYGLLGALTAIVAAGVGSVIAWAVLVHVMKTSYAFLPVEVAFTALGCTALTIAGGLIGTWRALGQPSAPLLRNP